MQSNCSNMLQRQKTEGSSNFNVPASHSIVPTLLLIPLPGCGCKIIFTTPTQHSTFVKYLHNTNFQRDTKIACFLRNAIRKYSLVVLSNLKDLSPQAHLNLTSIFAIPGAHPRRGKPPALPCLDGTDCLVEVATNDSSSSYLSKQIRADHWHSDVTFSHQPPKYTCELNPFFF